MYPCRTTIRKYLLNITMHYSIENHWWCSELLRSAIDSCGHCGRVVSAPVRLTDLSHKPLEETYYACPFCFSRLDVEDVTGHLEHSHPHETSSGKKVAVAVSNCSHEFGFLNSRPKDSAIPDECLTCPRILQCMVKTL